MIAALIAQYDLAAPSMGLAAREQIIDDLAERHSVPTASLYAEVFRILGRYKAIREELDRQIARQSLASPHMSKSARHTVVSAISRKFGISESTIYAHLKRKSAVGIVHRKRRADTGTIRAIPETFDDQPLRANVMSTIEQLHYGRATQHFTNTEVCRQLHSTFPALQTLFPLAVPPLHPSGEGAGGEVHAGEPPALPAVAVVGGASAPTAVAPRHAGEPPALPGDTELDINPRLYGAVSRIRGRLRDRDNIGDEPPLRLEAPHINFAWHIDDSVADFFVQPREPGDRPRRVRLSAITDDASRSCMAAHYVWHADRASWSTLVMRSIQYGSEAWPQCGVPQRLVSDHGKVFLSEHAARCLDTLGVKQTPIHAYHPHENGKIERFFRTVHDQFEEIAPGACPSDNKGDDAVDPARDFRQHDGVWWDPRCNKPLWSSDEATAALHAWISTEYHVHFHETLQESPLGLWRRQQRERPHLVQVPTDDFLYESFLISVGNRTVDRQRIRLDNLYYHNTALADLESCPVEVRILWDDPQRVWVFWDGRLYCEARVLDTVVLGDDLDWRDVKRIQRDARRQQQAIADHQRAIAAGPQFVGDPAGRLNGSFNGRSQFAVHSSEPAVDCEPRTVNCEPAPLQWRPPVNADVARTDQIRQALLRQAAEG